MERIAVLDFFKNLFKDKAGDKPLLLERTLDSTTFQIRDDLVDCVSKKKPVAFYYLKQNGKFRWVHMIPMEFGTYRGKRDNSVWKPVNRWQTAKYIRGYDVDRKDDRVYIIGSINMDFSGKNPKSAVTKDSDGKEVPVEKERHEGKDVRKLQVEQKEIQKERKQQAQAVVLLKKITKVSKLLQEQDKNKIDILSLIDDPSVGYVRKKFYSVKLKLLNRDIKKNESKIVSLCDKITKLGFDGDAIKKKELGD